MKKKVLFISDHGDPLAKLGGVQSGGQNNYVRQLALALEKQGAKVDVVTHWCDVEAPRTEAFGEHCRVIRIAAGHKGFVSKNEMHDMLPAFYAEMKKLLPLHTYDIVHTHYWLSGLLGKELEKEYGLPFVHTSHSLGIAKQKATGIRDEIRLNAEKEIMSIANGIVATTNNERNLICEFVSSPAPISVIPIGVATSFQARYNRPQLRKQLGYSGPLLVFAGRLEETKGIYELFDAFRVLIERRDAPRNTKLVIAGGQLEAIDIDKRQPLNEKLKQAIQGMEHYIEFVGPKCQEELALLFNAATATIVPSYYESFGMVAAEAQACGSPVIASRVGGLQNVVNDGETGLLVEPQNAEDLSLAIEALVTNNLLAQRLGKQATRLAKRDYQWPAISERINGVYEEVLANATERDASFGYRLGRDAGW
ncbi:glycosyltransferase [Aneurinibacillus aneurinilyticus]|uniref:Glycosyltransferase, group 1 family protein n=1 Tax=Aneurinibacillus aneurinilyticus ATCC 12856 TaxID=649747 RepID=U1YDZ8_ANEAE|nr:glycosyltransferase [Aneurinibacillus aneurinilyticus]ERI10297.1 glycosyltransferase, group 1 family protein [Aneurinibacillus aneurinilyticus ATCC 12856]MED0704568.1 glycosyltransferase [Aneurinibacillus aneurinilyticus]MED0725220.1 glycosyltransferase [Aneurinibacillus aneurinilyticus]MED0734446.1 glycosyltransferase [Aneurinibacillus aneurinilyticus]MED0742486.1 glycosyltransferase [Aneurinibacillus aneurinilyticus]